ncbi:unnamed protein product [Pseudo-nitzschia multistriata]|uniref:Uncharacterized protein n=1 Tax=Pseudo-nitzschia multistriata TaxID=183589 RepID=A0A448ZGU1_9STRA|nr:unnamed protein product [Pseudo-nitzschia multistriata]
MKTTDRMAVFFLSLLSLNSAAGFTSSAIRTSTNRVSSPLAPFPPSANKQERQTPLIRCNEKPGWLDDAMDGIPSGDFDEESYRNRIDLRGGIAGFSVDPELGFVCILVAGGEDSNQQHNKHWMPVVVSPVDTDRPKSAEALTCVQLAGGLDLGTAILPPDSLARLVAEHDAEEQSGEGTARDKGAPKRLSLTKITAAPNPDASENAKAGIEEEAQELVATSPEREKAISDALPKVETAVKTLPGLQETTTESVREAMQRFADEKGAVDRDAFSSILDSLRSLNTPAISLAPPLFRLDVSVIDGNGISQVTVDTTNSMIALGLAMRYKVTVDMEEKYRHPRGGKGVDELLERFPVFRPIQELNEDSRIVDGFIPSMFEKARSIDNDMKGE